MEDAFYMKVAYDEAVKAYNKGEIPIGAVIVMDNKIIASCHNMVEEKNDPTCHAELLAIQEAARAISNWRLSGATLYITLEPCAMCAGSIINSRIKRVVIGACEPVSGCCGSILDLLNNSYLNTCTEVKWLYDANCSELITNFFKLRRNL
ncbi:MAG: nucleoside deaminase [Oscillospiraceae bacterium]|nr:nucleoside deaminase [Oscillospiraceae bacterium]